MQPRDAAQRCELLLALGSAQMKAGDVPQLRSTFLGKAMLPEAAGALALLTRAALGVCTCVEVGVDQALVTLLEDTLYVLGEADSAERAASSARLALELYAGISTARRATLSQHAVAMARRFGDPTALAAALHTRRLDLQPGRPPGAPGHHLQMLQLAETTGDRERYMGARTVERPADLLELGEMRTVDLELAAYLTLAQALRQPRYLWCGSPVRMTGP